MNLSDDIVGCAKLVEQGDPDRFRTVMAAPVSARRVLFPLYAFNVEVSRAPWVTQEPMIAEMRLQWWRDVLEEIAKGKAVRKHEVTTPLAEVIDPEKAKMLDGAIVSRRWDIYKEAFEDPEHFDHYIDATAGHLMWAAAACLGARPEAEPAVRGVAYAAGVAAFLRAVPDLEASGRIPLIDGANEGVATLARRAQARLIRPDLPKLARAALWPAIGTGKFLNDVIKAPGLVADGAIPARLTSGRLSWSALTGWFMF
ncbi:MAG: squalene/phytoene synthase family protein [Tateyamaria sp.]|nr:squalene/phytoene synthase family protein [Tateyamaria sp.]MDG2057456.1 squalene/phytoene synthase family protein [Tateyamaria sp.]